MSWIFDFLQSIPLNSVLREKLATSQEKIASLEKEHANSKAEYESEKARVQAAHKEQVGELETKTAALQVKKSQVEPSLQQCLQENEELKERIRQLSQKLEPIELDEPKHKILTFLFEHSRHSHRCRLDFLGVSFKKRGWPLH